MIGHFLHWIRIKFDRKYWCQKYFGLQAGLSLWTANVNFHFAFKWSWRLLQNSHCLPRIWRIASESESTSFVMSKSRIDVISRRTACLFPTRNKERILKRGWVKTGWDGGKENEDGWTKPFRRRETHGGATTKWSNSEENEELLEMIQNCSEIKRSSENGQYHSEVPGNLKPCLVIYSCLVCWWQGETFFGIPLVFRSFEKPFLFLKNRRRKE